MVYAAMCNPVSAVHAQHGETRPDLQNPFREARELDGLSKALVDLPKAALYAAALAFVAVSGALGSYLGGRAPGGVAWMWWHARH